MDKLSAIPFFIAVVETGGFSAAARKLGVSKSAVSKRIAQLEENLGVKLLYRSTRRLKLTEAGELYFAHAAKALDHAIEAENVATQLQSSPRGRLRINVPMSFGRLHVAPIVPSFLKQYPGIQLDMVLDDRMVDLMQEGFDVAIRVGDLPDSNLIARPLAPMRYVVCATPNYISEHGLPKTPAELTKHNCLLFSYSLHEWTFQRQGSHETVQVQGNYHVNNSEALREALLQGAGVGRIPTFIVGPDIQSGKLIQLLTEYTIPMKTLFAVFPERRHMPAKVRVFVDFLLDSLGGDRPYWDNFSDARNY